MRGILAHLLVIDLTEELGAIAGRMLAELGAEVRRASPGELAWNHGKQPLGPGEAEALLGEADIVLRGPGLDHDTLTAANPALIDVVIAPFLPGGLNGDRPETDLTLMARSGLMAIVGDPDRAPLTLPGQQAYALAGIQAVIGALTALRARAESGRGQLVEVSAYQSAVLANYREPLTWGWTGRIGKRTGNLLIRGKSGVRQVWPCKDGWVTWALVDNPPMMRAMVGLLGDRAGPLAEVNWDTVLVADVARETLVEWEEIVAGFFQSRTRAELGELSARKGLGLSYIDTPEDALASDHLAARGLWREVDGVKLPGPLWLSSLDARP
ncbi:crotonobetainyl-CoA:carnitine CoA-transferase CaiB-like acyl-CoA transferase [Sphingomonas kaistensis]|uniref:Crotonobetainyl-CoA:carnitine CoA-transferase CaiB-like acyl-CoA transferase n=1 Tax=Sphingomonas kaistensis TaxID=298708 RepID=A0A7X5Y3A8_9SPHN|nr:CoA transferase [Sphingomonas kaistensis]NJC04392.1 crotonobetainyl-CoA:carnitine CoA-transferase CaiB-like acyl-CoA transferase [Sphingomonas kaistensis]